MQGGEVHRPGDQAGQRGGPVQVGGQDAHGRAAGHAGHCPHASQTGLRPPCQPAQLWATRRQGPGQHTTGEYRGNKNIEMYTTTLLPSPPRHHTCRTLSPFLRSEQWQTRRSVTQSKKPFICVCTLFPQPRPCHMSAHSLSDGEGGVYF